MTRHTRHITTALLALCLLVRGRRWKWGVALVLSVACLLAVKTAVAAMTPRLAAVAAMTGPVRRIREMSVVETIGM